MSDEHPRHGRLSARERRRVIVELANSSGEATVEEMAQRFDVTPSTIRRDLALLTSGGELARTYGGAMVNAAGPESSLRQRSSEAHREKVAIAAAAASVVGEGETILLDAGTTTGQLARALCDRRQLTIVGTGLTVLNELAEAEGVEVFCLGGRLRQISQGLVGSLAEAALERISADRVFLGADGLSAEDGICEASLEQTRLKEVMMARARQVYVVADSRKLGQRPFHAWARMPRSWTLITDDGAEAGVVEHFRSAGANVLLTTP